MEEAMKEENSLTGNDSVFDSKVRLEDSKLFTGKYSMSDCTVDIMIKKDAKAKKETYNLMQRIRHNTLIPHLNFYPDSNHGRLVLPLVGASFEVWIRNEGQRCLFNEDGSMTALFKTMILDICEVVEMLYLKKILIKNLTWSNLYMAREVSPRVLLLVTEAEVVMRAPARVELWKPVEAIIRWCYEQCNVQPNEHAERYISYISSEKCNVKSLKTYPENWDDFTKGEYMLSLIAANQKYIREGVRVASISWPLVNGKLPDGLQSYIDYEYKRKNYYSTKIGFDYVLLIRNVYKHFDKLPLNIKISLGNTREGFLRLLEIWTPTIWQDLYDVMGWP